MKMLTSIRLPCALLALSLASGMASSAEAATETDKQMLRERIQELAALTFLFRNEQASAAIARAFQALEAPTSGITLSEATEPAGARVEYIVAGSSADKSGLAVGDIIVRANNYPLAEDQRAHEAKRSTPGHAPTPSRVFIRILGSHHREQPLLLDIKRDQTMQTVEWRFDQPD